jgi:hypothetical protein
MRMSETRHAPVARFGALAHAGEVARWTLMLIGWLWLGEQGMRLGWSLASGVLAVALWWAARLLCRGSRWALQASPATVGWWGALSAAAVWLPEALRAVDTETFNAPHAGLLAVAMLWGVWSGMVETRSRLSTFDGGLVAWHPVLAVVLVAGVRWLPAPAGSTTGAVGVLLALCALLLHAHDRASTAAAPVCRGQRAGGAEVLAPSAMGLMMGGLWLGHAWCVGWGWSTSQMVLGHLVLMAVLPTLVALASRVLLVVWAPSALATRSWLIWVLLATGAGMLFGDTSVHGLLAMLLPSLAWALHCSRPRIGLNAAAPASPVLSRSLGLLLGPGLLLWVGIASPVQGPLAMQLALALLGSLAALQALAWCARPREAVPMGTAP